MSDPRAFASDRCHRCGRETGWLDEVELVEQGWQIGGASEHFTCPGCAAPADHELAAVEFALAVLSGVARCAAEEQPYPEPELIDKAITVLEQTAASMRTEPALGASILSGDDQ